MDYTYTIIIPHFNIPNLLRRLLESIPRRNDLQIIVVDDNSTEQINEFKLLKKEYRCVEWYDCRINGGGGKARNKGLELARGKYIIFADADDYFEKNFDSILEEYSHKDFDIAFFKGMSRDTDTFQPACRANHLNNFIDSYLNGTDPYAINLRYSFGEPWCRIVSRKMIADEGIKFDETKIHNDTAFSYLTGYHAKKIIVDPRPIYCVTTRKGSVSVTDSEDRILTRIEIFTRKEKFISDKNVDFRVREHYLQMARLLAHGRFRLLSKCHKLMRSMGYSSIHIYKGSIKEFLLIIKKRLCNGR